MKPSGRRPLRLLMVEDSDDDAELLLLELRRAFDVAFTRVETAEDMSRALAEGQWDIIVTDYSLPTFDAPSALRLLAASGLDIPCLVVSGTIGEETAVEALRAGAKDFLVKGSLSRLNHAVERELGDAGARAARRAAEQSLERSEARRRQSEEQARLLLDSTGEGILGIDRQGLCTFANAACLRMLLQPASLKGRDLHEVMHGGGDATAREQCRVCLASSKPEEAFLEEVMLTRADGSRFWAELRSVPLRVDGAHIGAVVSFVDITRRKQVEAQLRQVQKMDAIGSLAGGVAHDFNNILSVILGYATVLLDSFEAGDPIRDDLEEIKKAGLRAADLTRQLLAFGRQQMMEPRVLEINPVVDRLEKMLRRLLPANVELVLMLSPNLGRINADPSQIEQVIMNLVVNAGDAMPLGGRVTIETDEVELDDTYCATHVGVQPGRHVRIAVTDSGTGMDEATRARIFEPFFTTKEKGKGTGLGLSTVFGIVQQSGGHLWVYSELGHGTTFKVYFPCSELAPTREPVRPSSLPILHGHETILLVDDNDQLRAITKTILRRDGYTVLEAQNGGEAFLVCEQFADPIHLLLTDVVMPRMSGRELAERVTKLRPGMKVLYMSGYTESAIVHQGVIEAGIAFLQKPVLPEVLLAKLREVLDVGTPAASSTPSLSR